MIFNRWKKSSVVVGGALVGVGAVVQLASPPAKKQVRLTGSQPEERSYAGGPMPSAAGSAVLDRYPPDDLSDSQLERLFFGNKSSGGERRPLLPVGGERKSTAEQQDERFSRNFERAQARSGGATQHAATSENQRNKKPAPNRSFPPSIGVPPIPSVSVSAGQHSAAQRSEDDAPGLSRSERSNNGAPPKTVSLADFPQKLLQEDQEKHLTGQLSTSSDESVLSSLPSDVREAHRHGAIARGLHKKATGAVLSVHAKRQARKAAGGGQQDSTAEPVPLVGELDASAKAGKKRKKKAVQPKQHGKIHFGSREKGSSSDESDASSADDAESDTVSADSSLPPQASSKDLEVSSAEVSSVKTSTDSEAPPKDPHLSRLHGLITTANLNAASPKGKHSYDDDEETAHRSPRVAGEHEPKVSKGTVEHEQAARVASKESWQLTAEEKKAAKRQRKEDKVAEKKNAAREIQQKKLWEQKMSESAARQEDRVFRRADQADRRARRQRRAEREDREAAEAAEAAEREAGDADDAPDEDEDHFSRKASRREESKRSSKAVSSKSGSKMSSSRGRSKSSAAEDVLEASPKRGSSKVGPVGRGSKSPPSKTSSKKASAKSRTPRSSEEVEEQVGSPSSAEQELDSMPAPAHSKTGAPAHGPPPAKTHHKSSSHHEPPHQHKPPPSSEDLKTLPAKVSAVHGKHHPMRVLSQSPKHSLKSLAVPKTSVHYGKDSKVGGHHDRGHGITQGPHLVDRAATGGEVFGSEEVEAGAEEGELDGVSPAHRSHRTPHGAAADHPAEHLKSLHGKHSAVFDHGAPKHPLPKDHGVHDHPAEHPPAWQGEPHFKSHPHGKASQRFEKGHIDELGGSRIGAGTRAGLSADRIRFFRPVSDQMHSHSTSQLCE